MFAVCTLLNRGIAVSDRAARAIRVRNGDDIKASVEPLAASR
jgi:hypothetical protein